jgi:uroporphyrinogen decarboxylase
LSGASRSGADALGIDWRVSLKSIISEWPGSIYQGNLDPCILYADEKVITARVKELLEITADRPHIMNLGHGVTPDMPIDGVMAFVNAVKNG